MSLEATLLFETAEKLFAREITPAKLLDAQGGVWLDGPWQALEQAGLTQAMSLGEDLPVAEAAGLARIAGAHAVPLPLAETMLAHWLLGRSGLEAPDGVLTLAPVRNESLALHSDGANWRVAGTLRRVPWGRNAGHLLAIAEHQGTTHLLRLPVADADITEGLNLAFEPRDDLVFDTHLPADAVAEFPEGAQGFQAAGAALRALAMAGALAAILDICVAYANERSQFGRPIGKFQAIQQNMAILAGQAAAATGAGDIAAEALAGAPGGRIDILPIAIAKVRAGEAAGLAASLAHQIHGAIGFSQEYRLHFLTKRLWSWREEFGAEAEWSRIIGRAILADGPDRLWSRVAAI
ncbi:MAG: acyl-CoA/acyl-ACP dehydrogenase [Alphaproteobacteria bacterium]|nr:acyl-CoA/acyl-ACP dehydrogenase [Alphaproteobacteria bacterium]MBU0795786.1 acyl-CoA/acyl-ACP dehydrogenase [Alphaproteobacteria bacterium]MBU0886648.1 acyl-CoA/acyl-ACP dehydrogenase [Alphaproteobacteria bacterium]MBU1814503.1 acyl-CoA/acyl-ACP dehydrogenase [Alphaproteobacteria bacterium]